MTVVTFGTFDPLHEGHRLLLAKAAALGDRLIVVAARDSYIRVVKQREPVVSAAKRRRALEEMAAVSTVRWGDEWPNPDPYRLLRELEFEILALGYDQQPSDEDVRAVLTRAGRVHVQVVRLPSFR